MVLYKYVYIYVMDARCLYIGLKGDRRWWELNWEICKGKVHFVVCLQKENGHIWPPIYFDHVCVCICQCVCLIYLL